MRMRVLIKVILAIALLASSLLAKESGTATIFVFYNGAPLEKNEVLIDSEKRYFTDQDGSVEVKLASGKHTVEIFAKDEDGKSLGYARKNIVVKPKRDTQVIASFESDSPTPYVEVDIPVGDTEKRVAKYFGVLEGEVLSDEDSKAVPNARVFVKGTAIDARTDENGKFKVEVPADVNLTVSVVHSEYSSQTINNIRVKKDKTAKVTVKLTPASMELEEFVVLAPKVKGSIAAVMSEEKRAKAITNIIGSEQISKRGDSDAAGALKRVTGVTIVDGTDVYVRGLGGRYSNVEMNSMPLPSPDPQRRTVPLDIFPASVIESMHVQKSATADIPASFGGGYVNIKTKESPQENYFKITTEIKANSNTGKDVASYEGSSTDWLGYDNGYREIPPEILEASKIVPGKPVPSFDPALKPQYIAAITKRSFNITEEPLPPGGKVSIEGAYSHDVGKKGKLSVFGNYSYSQDHTYREEKYYKYNYNQRTGTLYETPNQFGDVYKTVDKYKNSGILNLHYNYADVLNLKFTQLYSKVSEKVTKITDGIAGSNDDWRITYDLNWEERTLNASQLSGDMLYNVYGYKNRFSFGAEIATALLDQPSNYRYTYYRNIGLDGVQIGDPYLDRYAPNVFLNLTTDDEMLAFFLKNRTEFEIFSDDDYFEIGLSSSSKTRESRYNKYRVNQSSDSGRLTDDIDTIYDNYLQFFSLDISFQPAYWYDAEVDETSGYVNLFLKPTKKTELLIGARSTDFEQTAYQYTNFDNIFAPIEKVPETLSFSKILPSMTFKYIFDEKNQVSFAYSQTYIVPDLREFTDTEYYHPYDIATVKGNPNLKNTDITNYDLKYSHYFSDTENITFGVFYKYLDKPIEDVLLPTSSLPRYSFDNADYATLYGVEVDGRKNLDFIAEYLKKWYLSGNFSYTKSEVNLTPEQQLLYTTNKRELQGLSPTVVNLTVGYERKDRSVTLSYNKMGERIRKVGMIDAQERYPDHYEVPPQIVDFVWIEKFKDLSLKLKLKNLLDEETIWYQGNKNNVTKRFKVGRFYSLSLSYKF